MITLGQARALFSRYAGSNQSFTEKINLVLARLLPEGNFKGTKVPARFVVYRDRYGNNIITLPRELEMILAGAYQAQDPDSNLPGTCWCGTPLPIRNGWYEFSPSGPGNFSGTDPRAGIILLNGEYTTFADWTDPMMLRVKLEEDESPGGTIIFRGKLSGRKIFTNGLEGVPLAFTNATVTTTQTFDEPPYQIIKPVTKGRIQLYSVDADAVETLIAYYDPSETNPAYTRYKVPVCRTDNT